MSKNFRKGYFSSFLFNQENNQLCGNNFMRDRLELVFLLFFQ